MPICSTHAGFLLSLLVTVSALTTRALPRATSARQWRSTRLQAKKADEAIENSIAKKQKEDNNSEDSSFVDMAVSAVETVGNDLDEVLADDDDEMAITASNSVIR